jgi:DNA-binding SARP family transcriptional activator
VGSVHCSSAELRLLGGFSLQLSGSPVALPMHSRRVLAYLSLDHVQGYSCDRGVLAERLWPDAGAERSRASLRTALWRIRRLSPHLVLVQPDTVRLGPGVRVDVHHFRSIADQMIGEGDHHTAESARVIARSTELLPGWDESWLVLAREQLRQARLHALEASAAHLRRQRRFPEAIDAMLHVIAEEPLRESAHAALIDAYLSEGNASEAMRQFDGFAALLWRELGIRPSHALCERVGLELTSIPPPVGRGPLSPGTGSPEPAQAASRSA